MELVMQKLQNGALVPTTEADQDKLRKIKAGAGVKCVITQTRNYKFLKKFMALIRFIFDIWEEGIERQQYKGQDVKPNIDRFRYDLTIMTGRYDATYAINGEVRLTAHSISFAAMSEDEFERLYSDTINVALARVINRPDLDADRVRAIVDELLRYD